MVADGARPEEHLLAECLAGCQRFLYADCRVEKGYCAVEDDEEGAAIEFYAVKDLARLEFDVIADF